MTRLIDLFKRTGRVTLIDKISDTSCPQTLDAMQAACGARGQMLTDDEIAAFARRRVELMRHAP